MNEENFHKQQKREKKVDKWFAKFREASIGKIFNGTRRPVKNLEFGIATNYQKLVRLRAADDNGYCQCVSCGRSYAWQSMNGGHYVSRANYATIVDFGNGLCQNVHPQCTRCNDQLSGNMVEYRKFMTTVYGETKVLELETAQLPEDHVWDKRELAELKVDYLEEIKSESKRLGVR